MIVLAPGQEPENEKKLRDILVGILMCKILRSSP